MYKDHYKRVTTLATIISQYLSTNHRPAFLSSAAPLFYNVGQYYITRQNTASLKAVQKTKTTKSGDVPTLFLN